MKQNNKKNIPVIGITGGVGSGKSVVMRMLEEHFETAVILADLTAHDLMEPGKSAYKEIVRVFGDSILAKDGCIDRAALGKIVFGDPEKLRVLNDITHPAVKREIISRIARFQEEGKVKRIALEAALLIEDGYKEMLDELWFVYADEQTRIRRLMDNRGYSEEKSRSIMERQLSEEVFREQCSRVIDNSRGMDELYRQLANILKE